VLRETVGVARPRREAGVWVGRLGRLGMVAQGVIYTLVAVLAIEVAVGGGGQPTDPRGALRIVADEWYGTLVLVLLAIGFGAYALWRFAVAALGEKLEGEDVGVGTRLAYAARGCAYAALSYSAAQFVTGSRASGEDEEAATATVLGFPAGQWLVGIAGAAIVGYGVWNVYKGLSRRFEKDLKTERMDPAEHRWIARLGRLGFLARAVVFGLVGAFLVKAALEYDPDEAIGLDGALQKLVQQPYGQALLGFAAAGLLAYGLFSFARARYREV
jgi:Domain of Unknown Function (DUF1206)